MSEAATVKSDTDKTELSASGMSAAAALPDPTRLGWTFRTWTTESTGGDTLSIVPADSTGNTAGMTDNTTLTSNVHLGAIQQPGANDFSKISLDSGKTYIPGGHASYCISVRLPEDVGGYAAVRIVEDFACELLNPRIFSITINGVNVEPTSVGYDAIGRAVSIRFDRALFNANDLIQVVFLFDVDADATDTIENNALFYIVPYNGNEITSACDTESITCRK